MQERSAGGDVQGFVDRALLWLQLLALAVGALHFAFAPDAVEHPMLAASALALLSGGTLLVRALPSLQRPRFLRHSLRHSRGALRASRCSPPQPAPLAALLLPLYLIPLTSVALAFGRWWLVLLLAAFIAGLVFSLGLTTPGANIGSPEFGVQMLSALAPGAAVGVILAGLIEEIRSAAQRISDLASTDSLTGLMNLRAFEDVLQQEHRKAERFGRPYTVLIIDVDNLAQVNEQLGHEAGSQILGAVASAISRSIRNSDVARTPRRRRIRRPAGRSRQRHRRRDRATRSKQRLCRHGFGCESAGARQRQRRRRKLS